MKPDDNYLPPIPPGTILNPLKVAASFKESQAAAGKWPSKGGKIVPGPMSGFIKEALQEATSVVPGAKSGFMGKALVNAVSIKNHLKQLIGFKRKNYEKHRNSGSLSGCNKVRKS